MVVQVLEGGRHCQNREVMGATNPANAAPGTIRKEFFQIDQKPIRCTAPTRKTAANEIRFFFRDLDAQWDNRIGANAGHP